MLGYRNRKFLPVMCLIPVLIFSLVGCAKPAPAPTPTPAPVPAPPAPGAKPAQVFKWRYQSINTPALTMYKETEPAFCDRMAKMSNGRLSIELYPAAALVPTREIVGGLAAGTIDMAYAVDSYFTGTVPAANIGLGNIPPLLLMQRTDAIVLARYGGIDDLLREGYGEKGVYYAGTFVISAPAGFWTKKPYRNMAEMKGAKIRTSGGYYDPVFEAVGAKSVLIPHEETYTAIATGTVDGSSTGISYYMSLKFYEVCPYFYHPLIKPSSNMCILVSLKSWKALPDDLKGMFISNMIQAETDAYARLWREEIDMYKMFPKWGTTIITLPSEDIAKMRKTAMDALDNDIAKKGPICAKGVAIIKDYMKSVGYID